MFNNTNNRFQGYDGLDFTIKIKEDSKVQKVAQVIQSDLKEATQCLNGWYSRPARALNVVNEKNLASLREISNFAHNNLLNILKL